VAFVLRRESKRDVNAAHFVRTSSAIPIAELKTSANPKSASRYDTNAIVSTKRMPRME
jgi:hypothetical protein